MSTKALIFDFYGVVLNEIGAPWYQDHVSAEHLPELKRKYDRPSNLGEISDDEFFAGIGDAVGVSKNEARAQWKDAIVLNEEMIAYINELKRLYKTAVLSNTQREFFRDILEKYDLGRLFDVVVVSSEVGMIKPSPDIYEYTLLKLGVEPHEAVFVDDREENVRVAQKMGIKGILYTDMGTLKESLSSLLPR